jgi:hypothetical protein
MRFRAIALLLVLSATPAMSQHPTSTSQTPLLDFSGVVFGNYQSRVDSAARAATGGRQINKFDLGRVYLNFRVPAGERGAIRVTTDLYQQTGAAAAYYAGWAVRLKYAYFQYDFTRNLFGVQGMSAIGRIGMLHNVVVEHMDSYWPRWLSQNAVETHGFFASADVGAASLISFPKRWGEAYVTIVNGSNYTAAENDRYKDFAARLSFTPFGRDSGFFRTLAITPWYSRGAAASTFVNGGPGQVGPVFEGLQKDRRGLFVGVRERRLTLGAEYSQRIEDVEGGLNTVVSPRTVRDRTSDLVAGFAFIRPLELFNPRKQSRFGVFGRYDDFELDNVANSSNQVAWAGLFYDINARSTITLDLQETRPITAGVRVPQQTWFVHWVAYF